MKVGFEKKIFEIIKEKDLELLHSSHPFIQKFHSSTSKLRDLLVEIENNLYSDKPRPRLSENHPFNVTLKYQLDYLGMDMPQIANQYCIAVASAYYFLPNTSDTKTGYFYSRPDLFFWYNIDFGYRLASSGWDRISYLLNIAFNLRIEKYNLSNVLKSLPKKVESVVNDGSFMSLKKFRDEKLHDLEYKYGGGARHETTHVISRSTRFFCEVLEKFKIGSDEMEKRRVEELKVLEDHHKFYIKGIQDSLDLMKSNVSRKFFK